MSCPALLNDALAQSPSPERGHQRLCHKLVAQSPKEVSSLATQAKLKL